MRKYRISSKFLNLLASYLTNRFQFVRINESTSKARRVISGVPQGSMMVPLQFLEFINDLLEHLPGIECYAFADDFKMLVTDDEAMKTVAAALDEWCSDNTMELNAKKCSIVYFKGRANAQLSGVEVDHLASTRDHGVFISNLTWDSNVNVRRQKALGAFFSIRRNMINHSNTALKMYVYTGNVVPILTYASQSWYANRSLQKTIEQEQKIATRWIIGGNETYKSRLTKLDLLLVTLYIEMHDVLYLTKLMLGEQDLQIKN